MITFPEVGVALLELAARIVAHPDCPKCGGTGGGSTCDVLGIRASCARLSQQDETKKRKSRKKKV
jgi:hypothetical protein